jgi:hypothetical protein
VFFIVFDRYRSWVILDNEEIKISDVYAHTVVDARRRAAQRALEALIKKQPSHVNEDFIVDNNIVEYMCFIAF